MGERVWWGVPTKGRRLRRRVGGDALHDGLHNAFCCQGVRKSGMGGLIWSLALRES
jgi:hypothetical protein